MVDIQCAAAEIRRGKKKEDRKKAQDENIMVCPIPQGDHNKRIVWMSRACTTRTQQNSADAMLQTATTSRLAMITAINWSRAVAFGRTRFERTEPRTIVRSATK